MSVSRPLALSMRIFTPARGPAVGFGWPGSRGSDPGSPDSGRSILAEGISPDVPISRVKLEAAAQSEFGPLKEADLTNHLENPKPDLNKEPGKEPPVTKEPPKTKEEIEEALALQDYPLNEALNLLKGINIMNRTGKAN